MSNKIENGLNELPTEAGRSEEKAEPERKKPDHDQEDAINKVFADFEIAYHNQFYKAFPDDGAKFRAKKFWLNKLRRFTPAQIIRASEELTSTQKFLPTLADMVETCRRDIALFGLPPVRRAYEEACLAPAPKADYDWSHEAVYLAGSAAGWSLLASEPESVSYPQFEYYYLDLCRQVVEGAELKIERPTPLPEQTRTELSAAELRKRLRKMRKELGL